MIELTTPLSEEAISQLNVGDVVTLTGYIYTGRDAVLPKIVKAAEDGIINKKVVAVGGINAKNIKRVKNMGFGGAAVLTGLWEHFDAHESINTQDIVKQFKLLRKMAD